MTIEEYFKDWLKVIDINELKYVLSVLNPLYKTKLICPLYKDIFRAFEVCDYNNLKVVFLGYDPYPDKYINKPRATGILFGNFKEISEDDLSPSLKIIKEAAINFEVNHYGIIFDQSLEDWAKQGILMINSALTVELNKTGSHLNIWRDFISKLLSNLSRDNTGIIYVLFGEQAKSFKPYIGSNNIIIEEKHPVYYARMNKKMSSDLFITINKLMKEKYNQPIEFYKELN